MAVVAHRTTKVRQTRLESRERIVTAATELVRRRAYAELSVDEVMREAGIGRTIFYRHFDDLADLLLSVSREAVEELFAAQLSFVQSRPGDATAAVRRALEAAVEVYQRHGPLLRCMAEAAAGDEQIAGGYAAMRRRFDDFAEQSLRERGRPRPDHALEPGRDRARAEPDERDLPDRRVRPRAARGARDSSADPDGDLGRGHPPLTERSHSMDVFRTPDERFASLPGYPYEPHYAEVDGLRLHHLDEGSGPTVLCFHGEPSWSYLYRHMLDRLVDTGNRVVCPDLVGFGRSDKPTEQAWYTYERHVDVVTRHLDQIDLEDVTVVVQDWGGPIGLRWAVEHADQVARLVILNTGLFTGRVSKGFMAWRDFAERTPDLPIGMILQGATTTDLAPEVVAAYEAPFPTPESKAGAQRFPLLVPLSADDPGVAGDAGHARRAQLAGTSRRWSRSPTPIRCSRSRRPGSSSPS